MKQLFDNLDIQQGILPELYSEEEIIESAFKEFRERGFPYPNMTIAEMKIELNNLRKLSISRCRNSLVGYQIADTFNKHRFHSTTLNGCSPIESFKKESNLKILFKIMFKDKRPLNYSFASISFITKIHGTQACSNFRPAFAKYIYIKYCPEKGKIFDPSMGYGGRLVGFLASYCNEYIGTDPNTLSFKGNKKLSHILNKDKKIKLYNLPIEDFDTKEYQNYFDLSFTSPPYFKKEIYSDEDTQSCNRYPEYKDWIKCFLTPFFQKQYEILKKNCFCVVNIEDVKINSKMFGLVNPSIEIAKRIGFNFIKKEYFNLATARRRKNEDGEFQYEKAQETILIFKKEK